MKRSEGIEMSTSDSDSDSGKSFVCTRHCKGISNIFATGQVLQRRERCTHARKSSGYQITHVPKYCSYMFGNYSKKILEIFANDYASHLICEGILYTETGEIMDKLKVRLMKCVKCIASNFRNMYGYRTQLLVNGRNSKWTN